VLTSVDRDELPDGGAGIWAETIREVRRVTLETSIEVLVPDFKGVRADIDTLLDAGPDVFAHNIETVRRLQKPVRPQASYGCSLSVLRHSKSRGFLTKSGIMAGLGETEAEIRDALADLAAAGVDIVTIGQYLQPSTRHLPVHRWVTPDEFRRLKQHGESLGIRHVESGPLVRSSYRAGRQVREMMAGNRLATGPPAQT
jgi:lipoic acid synthetase